MKDTRHKPYYEYPDGSPAAMKPEPKCPKCGSDMKWWITCYRCRNLKCRNEIQHKKFVEKIETSCIDVNTPTISDLIRIGSVREYRKYEFCDAERCRFLRADRNRCLLSREENCPFTAKEFHHWLKDDGFEIVKKVK